MRIINSKDNIYPDFIGRKTKNILYWSGYLNGENVLYGSNFYLDHIDFENQKEKNEEKIIFSRSLPHNITRFYEDLSKQFLPNQNITIPKIEENEKKRLFLIGVEYTTFKKMEEKSSYDAITIFVFMLIIEEISSLKIYIDHMIDLEKTIEKEGVLLYFFTKLVAIKYDEIKDSIDVLIKHGKFNGVDSTRIKEDIDRINIFSEEVSSFACKLRNSLHYENFNEYDLNLDDEQNLNSTIEITEIFLDLVGCNDWPADYLMKLNLMRCDLDKLWEYCRKNVGIKY